MTATTRHFVVLFSFVLFFFIAFARTCQVALLSEKITKNRPHSTFRGQIESTNGEVLAFSVPTHYLYVNNREPLDNNFPLQELSTLIGISQEDISKTLEKNPGGVVLLKPNLPGNLVQPIQKLDNPKLIIETLLKRRYPFPQYLAHVLGFVGRDGTGLAGVERSYDDFLSSQTKEEQHNLKLSINMTLQKHAEDMLDKAIKAQAAEGGFVVVQEVKTGLIRAMVSRPGFNLDDFSKANPENFKNRIVSNVVEPGSIMKTYFMAFLLENKLITEDEKIPAAASLTLINGEIIRSTGDYGKLNIGDIIAKSSNSAMILAMDRASKESIYDYLKKLYFFQKTNIDLPGETNSLIPPLKDWGIRTTAVVTIGYGISLSPIQIISSFNGIINDGVFVEPRLVENRTVIKEGKTTSFPTDLVRRDPIVSKETSEKFVRILYNGTKVGSTGVRANVGNYISIGKTSTAQLMNAQKKDYSSGEHAVMFIGAYPYDKPVFSILVGVSRPKKDRFAGTVAAPLYADIIPVAAAQIDTFPSRESEVIQDTPIQSTPLPEYKGDVMPRLLGKSLRQVLVITEQIRQYKISKGEQVTFDIVGGVGYVKKQSIPPGTPIKNGDAITLEMGDP